MFLRLREIPASLECEGMLTADSLPALAGWGARPGMVVTVVAPGGAFLRGRLLQDEGRVHLFAALAPDLEPPVSRRLGQALPDKERMSWIIQKAVELGATAIVPLACPGSSRKRWNWAPPPSYL